jgi:type IV secretory pathway VirB10-like protein
VSERKPEDPWLEAEEEPRPRPWWKTARVWWLAVAIAALIGFIFSQGQRPADLQTTKPSAPIAVVQPYTPIVQEAKAAPEPPASPPAPAPLPPPPPPINLLPPPTPTLSAKPPAPARPAMLSYAVPTPPPAAKPAEPAEPAHTGIKFATATLPGAKASPAIDDTLILYPGLLPCELDTAIDGNLAGPLMCHLPGLVYSRKGFILMEAMSQVMGKYEPLTQSGSERLHATNTFAFTPNGVWVPLSDMPMADDLGRTGLAGSVDRRYMERFGGAVILDLGQASLGVLKAAISKGGNTYFDLGSTGGLASQILHSEINKPPIFTKHQSEMIAIWITHPISFEDSYKPRVAGP